MLAITFFVSIFSSILWIIYAISKASSALNGASLDALGLPDMALYLLVIFAPVLIIWMIFGYVLQYIGSKTLNQNLFSLFKQMKKNQDYTDLIARIMLEAEQEIKDGFIINKFDLFIADMNELIAEIIYRCNIASGEQVERLWSKVQNGGKWAFGKVVVEVNSNQPNFQMRVFEKSQIDAVLAGTILEFCARYLSLVALLEKHDKSRVFLTMVETGVFGKVFSIMAPVSDEIRKKRDVISAKKPAFVSQPQPIFEPQLDIEGEKKSFVSKINPFKKKNDEEAEPLEQPKVKDPFSMALERSFGDLPEEKNEPIFAKEEEVENHSDIILEAKEERNETTTNTQRTINSLKKEWEMMRQTEEQKKPELSVAKEEEKIERISYPFSGWVDEDNYTK